MGSPSTNAIFVCGYAVVLLVIAVAFDRLGARSAIRSAAWRTGNFLYHDDADAWKCHEDQWLWPASFDPDKRVVRYVGQHAICGRCPAKAECSPTPGPREITRQVDPWPHSEAGRFHRGVSLAVAAVALMMVVVTLLVASTGPADVVLLLSALALVLAVGIPLARHLWNTPDGFPQHLDLERGADSGAPPGGSAPGAPATATVYRSQRLAAAAEASERDGSRGSRVGTDPLSAANVDAVLARHRAGGERVPAAVTLPTPRYRSDRRNS